MRALKKKLKFPCVCVLSGGDSRNTIVWRRAGRACFIYPTNQQAKHNTATVAAEENKSERGKRPQNTAAAAQADSQAGSKSASQQAANRVKPTKGEREKRRRRRRRCRFHLLTVPTGQ